MRLLLYTFSFLLILTACQKPTPSPPNVLFILTDDQGYGDLRIHGNDSIDTPVIDSLARSGARLDQFYVSPVCAPTRASLLTGRYHLRTGTFWVTRGAENMREEELTLPEVFQANGYATGAFGKWHNGAHYPHNPQGQGFDEFFGFCSGHWSNYFNTTLIANDTFEKTEGYITDVLTDKAIDFIGRNKNQPFFCYLPYNVPHSPFQLPDQYFDKYKARGLSDKNASVYGMVENLDDNLRRLFGKLDQWGLTENTIVVFITDNGPNGRRYNGGMRGIKGWVYEGGVRVPCFISWPGHIPQGIQLNDLTDHIDMLPTLVGLTGVAKPAGLPLDGLDLSPFFREERPPFPERTLYSHQNQGASYRKYPGAVRNEQYHLVVYDEAEPQLFDMQQDPAEQNDLADSLPEISARMFQQYHAWWEEVTRDGPTDPAIPVGYAQAPRVELPAHEARLSGNITYHRNPNGWAHDWIVNWQSTEDQARWEIKVVESGSYAVELQYTCPESELGSKLVVRIGEEQLELTLDQAFVPEIMPNPDRVAGVRTEAREQTWGFLPVGTLELQPGKFEVVIQVSEIANVQVGDIKGLIVKRQ